MTTSADLMTGIVRNSGTKGASTSADTGWRLLTNARTTSPRQSRDRPAAKRHTEREEGISVSPDEKGSSQQKSEYKTMTVNGEESEKIETSQFVKEHCKRLTFRGPTIVVRASTSNEHMKSFVLRQITNECQLGMKRNDE
jgi:hypothetical protein